MLVLSLLVLDLLSIFWWGHFDIFQYFFTYFFQAFHNNFWVLDPILEANYKRYVRVIEVKDLLASSHLRHADSFCFYYYLASDENVETFDHSLHSLYSYHFRFAAYFIFHPLLMNCLFPGVKEWVCSSYGSDQLLDDLFLDLSNATCIFVRSKAFFLLNINFSSRFI